MPADVIVHIPHASAVIPEHERVRLAISADELEQELLRMTDWYTDDLFDLGEGAIRVIFPVSRLVCDPERFLDDSKELVAARGMGVVYTHTSDGRPLRPPLDAEERQRLLHTYYFPHHRKLEQLVRSALADYDRCLIVDAHSFPSSPLPCDQDQDPNRPDICIGTDEFHTPEWLQQASVHAFGDLGWRVELNRPHAGAMVPRDCYRKDTRVHSVMVEVSRSLYMDEDSGARSVEFGEVRRKVRSALDAIIAASP